jgi:hypothetical protein
MNAAPHYRRASTLLAPHNRAELRILANANSISLSQTTANLIQRTEPALEELFRGAMLPECDWGPASYHELDADSKLSLPIYQLSQIACLRIRHTLQRQDPQTAIDDLLKLVKVARDFGRGGTYLFKIAQFAVESLVVDTAAANLPEQDALTVQTFVSALEKLPSAGSLLETVQQEKRYLCEYVRSQIENTSLSASLDQLCQMASKEEAECIIRAATDKNALLRLVDALATLFDEVGTILMDSADQQHNALATLGERHAAANPLVMSFIRHTEVVAYAAARADARLAMLQAALAAVHDGTEIQQILADSGRCGQFEICSFNGGFDLTARLPFPGRPPVTLTIGKKKGWGQWFRRFISGLAPEFKEDAWKKASD